MSERTILVIRQSVAESIVSDAWTFGCLVGSIAVGVYLGSDALQWIAGLLTVIAMVSRAAQRGKLRMTVDEARRELDRIEAEAALARAQGGAE